MLLLGVGVGALWALWADPGRWEVTEAGAVLSQRAASAQFGVELLFGGLGAVAALVWAFVAGVALRHAGWLLVPLCLLLSALAGLVAWQVGMALGPPDPRSVTGLSLGDTFPDEIRLDSFVTFLAWPVGALTGLVLGLMVAAEREARAEPVDLD